MDDLWSFLSNRFNLSKDKALNIAIGGVGLLILVLIYGIFSSLQASSRREMTAKQPLQRVSGTMEVLNGSGKSGFNDVLVDYMRKQGLDVVHSANYHATNVPSTIIIIRNGNPAPAYYIAGLLSIDSSRVVRILNKDCLVDATVIVGKDISSKKF